MIPVWDPFVAICAPTMSSILSSLIATSPDVTVKSVESNDAIPFADVVASEASSVTLPPKLTVAPPTKPVPDVIVILLLQTKR